MVNGIKEVQVRIHAKFIEIRPLSKNAQFETPPDKDART